MNVAVIPARGGSKRIPRKNIRAFCGRPMIAWTVQALQRSGSVDRIVVSTDDDEIAEVARSLGALVPFRRPAALADDHAATLPVMAHAVRALVELGWPLQRVCCAYATAPLMDSADLRDARALLDDSGAAYVFSCTTFPFPIQRALGRSAGGGVEPLFPQSIGARSQDLPEAFHDAGQFYWGLASAFAEQRPIFAAHSRPLLIPRHRVQDIETEEDWQRAELLFRSFHEEPRP
jgi:N-acylneuraminate cytidylyltransferase